MPLRVLAVASECYPLVKTGGLADVVGALPGALAAEDVAITTLIPGYPGVLRRLGGAGPVAEFAALFGGPARVLAAQVAGLDLLVLDAPHLFDRAGGPYAGLDGQPFGDNALRFAALSLVAALLGSGGTGLAPYDVLHAHDWQTGLAGAYLRHIRASPLPVVFTIHNLAFQGQFPAGIFPSLGLPPETWGLGGVEYFGQVGFLKAGLWFANRVTTVSPGYAAEILTPEGGMGMDGLLRGRAGAVSGILNGLDLREWDPATDPHLPARYSAAELSPRAANKAALQARLGLAADPAAPLFGFVGRLAWQKGVDLMLEALPALLGGGAQLAILGAGEPGLVERCMGATGANPGRIGSFIGYDEGLARLFYAGADAILVPSRFEPCGLAQLCALRYGALPVVARVGGLADTVVDANEAALAAGAGNGVQFSPVTVDALMAAIRRTLGLYADRALWARLQANALAADVSWRRSAGQYAQLFRGLVPAHG